MVEGLGRIGFGLFGLVVLLGITWLFSNNKKAVDWKLIATGIALQIAFAALVLLVPGGRDVFDWLGQGFVKILSYVNEGSSFIFGDLMNVPKYGFIFAFQVLPTIIFFSALMGVMYHLGVMQAIVKAMAWAITKIMRVSGAETTSVCASVFIGQTEAPLTVRPYIARMTQSELITMMIGGMAHIAGGVLAAYVGMLGGGDPVAQAFYAKHLLAASIMAAPATLVISKLLVPETQVPLTRGTVKMEVEKTSSNIIDAAAGGAADGLKLALNIGAMLLAFIALDRRSDRPCTGNRQAHQPGYHLRLHPGPDRLGDRHPMGRCHHRGFADRPEGGHQRIRGLPAAGGDHQGQCRGRGPERRRPADRHLRAVRLRQLQLDRDPDRRHRWPGPRASPGSGQVRPARRAWRHHRHPDDGHHCRRADPFRLIPSHFTET